MTRAWLRFFRVVNLPTVPGDVLVGAAAVLCGGHFLTSCQETASPLALVAACAAGVLIYMFGLADNDIVGAATDADRPIPEGCISFRAARIARGLCLFGAMIAGAVANLPPAWWIAAFALAVTVVVYNRTKWCFAMGLCRGLNVACGGAVFCVSLTSGQETAFLVLLSACIALWTLYIAVVTKYSEGEDLDPEKKRRVGFLIGAIVYLQLIALIVLYVRPLLIAGAVLLVVLRLMKRLLPEVSAS